MDWWRCGPLGDEVSGGSESGGPDTGETTCGLRCMRPLHHQMYPAVTLLTETNPEATEAEHTGLKALLLSLSSMQRSILDVRCVSSHPFSPSSFNI